MTKAKNQKEAPKAYSDGEFHFDTEGMVSISRDRYVWKEGVGGVPIQGHVLDVQEHPPKEDMPGWTQVVIRTTCPTMAENGEKQRMRIEAGEDVLVAIKHGTRDLEKIARLDNLTTEVYLQRTGTRPIPGTAKKVVIWDIRVKPNFRPLSDVAPEYAALRGMAARLAPQLPAAAPERDDTEDIPF